MGNNLSTSDCNITHDVSELPNVIKSLSLSKSSSVAFVFAETDELIDRTVNYYIRRGFKAVFLFMTEDTQHRSSDNLFCFKLRWKHIADIWPIINRALPYLEGHWLYWGLNGEFLFYPFCETRTIDDLSTFLEGERRDSLFSYVIDLYSKEEKEQLSSGEIVHKAHFDLHNYYALPAVHFDEKTLQKFDENDVLEDRFIAVYGGLKWRFVEYVPKDHQRIDRVPYFYVRDGMKFDENGICNNPEFHSYHCKYHHNPTGAVMSFHVARYFMHNPETRAVINDFKWQGSQRFNWTSEQLMRLGFIETGQWF